MLTKECSFFAAAELIHESIAIVRVVADAAAADGRDAFHAVLSIADRNLQQAERELLGETEAPDAREP